MKVTQKDAGLLVTVGEDQPCHTCTPMMDRTYQLVDCLTVAQLHLGQLRRRELSLLSPHDLSVMLEDAIAAVIKAGDLSQDLLRLCDEPTESSMPADLWPDRCGCK